MLRAFQRTQGWCRFGRCSVGARPSDIDALRASRRSQVHPLRDCPERVVWCKWNCKKANLLAKDQAHHEEAFAVCPARSVVCRFGCGVMTLGRTVKFHEERECRKCFLQCTWGGCSKVIDQRKQRLPEHMADCEWREVVCELCGNTVLASAKEQHDEHECGERRKPCENGCGVVVYAPRFEEVRQALAPAPPASLLCVAYRCVSTGAVSCLGLSTASFHASSSRSCVR